MTPSGRTRRPDPRRTAWLLTALLAVGGGVLAARAGTLPEGTPAAAVLALAAAFAVVELGYVSAEFRRQTYSFTVAGVPLVLGLLLVPVWQVVAARVVGAGAALLWQRLVPVKAAYNLAAYAFETALAGTLLHAWAGVDDAEPLTPGNALVVVGVVLGVDLVMSTLVLGLVRLHHGPLGRADVLGALVPSAAFNLGSAAYALVAAVLLERGPLGLGLLAALTTLTALAYRSHVRLSARHSALEAINGFVEQSAGADSVEALAGDRLARVRALLGAGTATAVLRDGEGVLSLTVGEDEDLRVENVQPDEVDALLRAVSADGSSLLAPRGTRDPALRRWLQERRLRDAVVVPVGHGQGVAGALLVGDRPADAATFTPDDVTVLRTLAGHLGVALRNTRLLGRLRHDATHDVLTGLANRALLQERLATALQARGRHEVAVLLLDLDGFKEVNDALGHDVGDRLLVAVAERLREVAPVVSTVARLGGDEFAVLLPQTTGAAAERLAAAIADALVRPVAVEEATLSVAASVGVATTEDGTSPDDLLRHADTAMYAAKSGSTAVRRYDASLDLGRAERLELLADLRVALEQDELFVAFQPQLDLRTGALCGAEALVRWEHPRLGTLAPDRFIAIAESTGLIGALTEQVLDQALEACRGWRAAGLDLTVSVNLSALNVGDEALVGVVQRALQRTGLPPTALVLEITESAVMVDPESAVPVLERLVAAGTTLSLDDFGTGYSSLAYLQRLPVQEVKVDRSFVLGLGQGGGSDALVASILGLARALRLRVVAEGVEDATALARLVALGCDVVQGYHLGRPGRAEEVPLLAARLAAAPLAGSARPALAARSA